MSKQIDKKVISSVLPPEVDKGYQLADGIVAQFFCSQFGHVDLTKIDIEFAERLCQEGILIKKAIGG